MSLINFIKNIFALLLLLNLTSCAIETKKELKEKPAQDTVKKIEVDAGIMQQFKQATQLLEDKKYQQAIELFSNIVKKEKRFPAPFVNLAIAYARQNNTEKAEKFFRRALEIDLGHAVANNELGILYRKQGRFSDARKAYENALAVNSESLLILRNFGILCDLYLADLDCAQQLYSKYLDIEEDKDIKIWLLDLERRM